MKPDAAIFDIDGTLLPMSLERMLIACMLRHKLVSWGMLVKRIASLALKPGGKKRFLINKFYLQGLDVERVENLLEQGCWEEIRGRFFPTMLNIAGLFREADVPIILLSGTIDVMAKRVAAMMDADLVISSRLEVVDGKFTGRIQGIYPYREGKVQLAEQIISASGWDWARVWAFGDSGSDIPLLTRVGNPVAVNPSKELRKLARRNGYLIIDAGPRFWLPFRQRNRAAKP